MTEKSMQAVPYFDLWIPSYEMLHLEEFELIQQINCHTVLEFSGTIQEEEAEYAVFDTAAGREVEVYYRTQEEGEKQLLFCGVVIEVKVVRESSIPVLRVKAYSNTYFLDLKKKKASYQKIEQSYESIFQEVLARTKGARILFYEPAKDSTGEFILQYQETDWEFLKRMASRFHKSLIPDSKNCFPTFYYGVTDSFSPIPVKGEEVRLDKDVMGYEWEKENDNMDSTTADYMSYLIKSYEFYEMGKQVMFRGQTFYIRKAICRMENGLLVTYYELCSKKGMGQRRSKNIQISGVSLNGQVRKVQRDQILVQLALDEKENAYYYFPYSTMSASPDGSGWYFMPEVGDEVRVYLPNEEEKYAYAISSASSYVPKKGDTKDRMSDPAVKYLRTAGGMQLTLKPDEIEINAADGKAVIKMRKDGSISIQAASKITVDAQENISFISHGNINICASEKVELEGVNGSYVMAEDGTTRIKGQYVMEN